MDEGSKPLGLWVNKDEFTSENPSVRYNSFLKLPLRISHISRDHGFNGYKQTFDFLFLYLFLVTVMC